MAIFLTTLLPLSDAQKDRWLLYPTEVDFTAGPSYTSFTFPNPAGSIGTPYIVENSVFSSDGDLLFYVQDGFIYNADGEYVNTISNDYPGISSPEIGIAPVPGACNIYCVFAIYAVPLAASIFTYAEVVVDFDVPGNTYANVSSNGIIYGGNAGTLTVSQVIPGTQADRHIYVVSYGDGVVDRYTMTADTLVLDHTVTLSRCPCQLLLFPSHAYVPYF